MQEDFFALKPLKAAKVSEISEATAMAPVPDKERVNFHIGHPIQDNRLTALFRQLVFQTDPETVQDKEAFQRFLGTVSANDIQRRNAQFVFDAIPLCNPYMPRGGYNRRSPGPLVERIRHWLENEQLEPLKYDIGQQTGHKELMLGSGGLVENIRVFLFMLNRALRVRPAVVWLFNVSLPNFLFELEQTEKHVLPNDEEHALAALQAEFQKTEVHQPHFVFLGAVPSEKFRRHLRELVLAHPLFVVEVNNAPNHFSLAREALLADRVLRFLTPEAVNPGLKGHSIVLVMGRADYIQHLETVHFELKGTPSAPEAELLHFALSQEMKKRAFQVNKDGIDENIESELQRQTDRFTGSSALLTVRRAEEIATSFTRQMARNAQKVQGIAEKWQNFARQKGEHGSRSFEGERVADDSFSSFSSFELINRFFDRLDDKTFIRELKENFLEVFLALHSEYEREACAVVSGSARTALGLLGHFGPIKKVATLDLSWTYEHCFPHVETLPLSPLHTFSAKHFIEQMEALLLRDSSWHENGAIVFNNPHNATGRILPEEELRSILHWALRQGVRVIDDLSYQNVGPWQSSRRIKTLKQLVAQLVRNGYIAGKDAEKLITIHSLSKTDSFAGARLTVVEIPEADVRTLFLERLKFVRDHRLPLLIAYLFYRNGREKVENYWDFRNRLFARRMSWLKKAEQELPEERNPFLGTLQTPAGSMYPLLFIKRLPAGISLETLSSNLANQGIGLVPLTTFARTAQGYQIARNAFRLTLGGSVSDEQLYYQMRRVLIGLNRLIAQEASAIQKKTMPPLSSGRWMTYANQQLSVWEKTVETVHHLAFQHFDRTRKPFATSDQRTAFVEEHLRNRLVGFTRQFNDKLAIWQALRFMEQKQRNAYLQELLQREFYKDNLASRQQRFRKRILDRTVHPTQMYALSVDIQAASLMQTILRGHRPSPGVLEKLARELVAEFFGETVPINSVQEADELLQDLNAFVEAEILAELQGEQVPAFLSFWGDWDGSTRPSGQGHRLVGAVVIENVSRLANILTLLLSLENDLDLDPELRTALQELPRRREKFWKVLNEITALTNQLEKRYRSLLPAQTRPGFWRSLGMKLGIAQDPLTALWTHNDRLERKMRQLRNQRRKGLEEYFLLNKKLRKALHASIPAILKHSDNSELLFRVGFYRDLLKRFVLTPRIHQNMITSVDPFAIDTTVFNLTEINELGGNVGNAGLILALQVSMTSKTEALIRLEQKLRARKEAVLRRSPRTALPDIWVIPLFEDYDVVKRIETYLNELWNYVQSHRATSQSPEERFSQMLCEIFVAGSDLSQQVGQALAAQLYKETKFKVVKWLAQKGLLGKVRLKLGSGEPMQRQGGFYDAIGSTPAFLLNHRNKQQLNQLLLPPAAKSAEFAITPLRGVFSSGDLRTFQSTISEKLRMLPASERANTLYHVKLQQQYHDQELLRAGEPLISTRLQYHEKGEKELRRLTLGWSDPMYDKFLQIASENFRQIVYGRDEDVVGIHIVSYFVSRMTPSFRDRPTIRPGNVSQADVGQKVVERLTRVLPLSKHGTLLRAIGHNRAQTMILGINQLTTGLFRALKEFANDQQSVMPQQFALQERILPYLPVYEILNTLRLYQDVDLEHFRNLEPLFPAGNSALFALHEDTKLMHEFIPLFQVELVRRHGLPVGDFFENGAFRSELLPTLRPDLAVLLQENLFNTEPDVLLGRKDTTLTPDEAWLRQTEHLLRIPVKVRHWRKEIWQLIGEKVAGQVESFVQLSQAIDVLLKNQAANGIPFQSTDQRVLSQLHSGLRNVTDDNLKQFLLAAMHYLNHQAQAAVELPVNVMRALRDVERIVKIEQQPLSSAEQEQLRFYILQIARLTGENG